MASAGAGGRWVEFIRRSWIATSMRNLAAVAIANHLFAMFDPEAELPQAS